MKKLIFTDEKYEEYWYLFKGLNKLEYSIVAYDSNGIWQWEIDELSLNQVEQIKIVRQLHLLKDKKINK